MKKNNNTPVPSSSPAAIKNPSPNATAIAPVPAGEDRRTTKVRKAAMIVALEKCLGVVTQAVLLAGIDRKTHYRWLEKDEKYKAKVMEMEDVALDFAESKLFQRMKDGDTFAITFLLKTRGKKRGYIERSETTGADGAPLEPKRQVFIIGGKEIEF